MSKEQIIYIEDQEQPKRTFSALLQRIYGSSYQIEAPDLKETLQEMLSSLFNSEDYKKAVAFMIDERLKFTGETNYLGSELAAAIRDLDEKIPVYILTSYKNDVDPLTGTIEFVIDKNDLSNKHKHEMLSQRLLRHLKTYEDIRSERAKRFDELLNKSLSNPLTDEEKAEYDTLNIIRTRSVLMDEKVPTEQEIRVLNEQQRLIDSIQEEIDKLKGN